MFKKTFLITIFLMGASCNISYAGYLDRQHNSLAFMVTVAWINLNFALVSSESFSMLPAPDSKGTCSSKFHCNNYRCVRIEERTQLPKQVDHSSQDFSCSKDAAGSYNQGSKGFVLK
jgi:hypothetical protein